MPRNAFAFVERLYDANSLPASEAALEKILARFGLANFVLMDLPDTRRRYDDFMFCRRVPAE
jgi:LuxR family quorum sensing-dependent transcriptional regulator